jgi:signal transduction histidine kinase
MRRAAQVQPGTASAGPPGGAGREPVRVRRALVGAFAAVAVVFTVGLAASHTFVAGIRSSAREITENSAPSISSLSSMRSVLRQLEVAANQHLAACAAGRCAPPPARLAELQRDLLRTWDAYRLLPTSAGETELWPGVDADLHRLGELLAVILDAASRGDGAALHDDTLGPAFDAVDDGVARIVELDHAVGVAMAERIETLARLSTVSTVALDLLTVALTALVAALAVRLVHRYERSLRERADELDQFAGRVAHDVKGPLTATAAALHALRRVSPEAARDPIDRGERAVRRVQRLVDDLLEFARAGAPERRDLSADLREVVEDVVGQLEGVAGDHQVELRVDVPAHQRVACSPGVLTSIVQNLVQNAITHMGASRVRLVQVRAAPAAPRDPVRIEVQDSGPGIPGALGARVFEPFVRGDGPVAGTGLGLATVKRFVDAHGGRVGFAARPEGTLFWLELPGPENPPGEPATSRRGM